MTVAAPPALTSYLLALGDDALILAQRLGEWVAAAPQIEEDIALANIGLDLLGQARTLLGYAAEVEGAGRSEDDLAFWRDEGDFTNAALCELPNGDFALTMARQLVFSTYQLELYGGLLASTDATLAAVAGKAVKEVAYHRDHASQWVVRLGDGTQESHRRMQAGLDEVWPYVGELLDDAAGPATSLVEGGVAVAPGSLRPAVDAHLDTVLAQATLDRPGPSEIAGHGRRGQHTAAMAPLLAQLQSLAREHPGATW